MNKKHDDDDDDDDDADAADDDAAAAAAADDDDDDGDDDGDYVFYLTFYNRVISILTTLLARNLSHILFGLPTGGRRGQAA